MNKNKYIKEVDSAKMPDELKERIAVLEAKPQKKHTARAVAAIAACLAVLIVAVPAFGSAVQMKSSSDSASFGNGIAVDESGLVTEGQYEKNKTEAPSSLSPQADRKIIRSASVDITVKSIDEFAKNVRAKLDKYGGYTGSESYQNYDDSRSCNMRVHVPADKLESFLTGVEASGTVNSKNIGSDDVTDSYIDSEAKIRSLETELNSLLKILEKAEKLEDVIKLQERISQVRGELDSCKSQLKALDGRIEYAEITISVYEKAHTVKNDGSFGAQVKEKFMNSIYSIGEFFSAFAVTFIGSVPYLLIITVAAVVIIIIIKKKDKKKDK